MRPMVLKEPLRDVKKVVLPFNEQSGMEVSKGQIVGVWHGQSFCTVGRDELMLFPSTQVVNRVAEWSLTTNLFSSSEFFSYVLLPPCYCSSSRLTLLVCNLRRKSMAFGYAPSFLATKEENSQASLMNLKLQFKYENYVFFVHPDFYVFQTFCGDLQYLRLDLRSFQAYLTRSTLPSIFWVVFYRWLLAERRIAQEAEENLLLIILDLEVHLDDDEKVQKNYFYCCC